jgi:hypothetical protein
MVSSSTSSCTSFESDTSGELTPKFNLRAAYEALAPLHWDTKEWDFNVWSKDEDSSTEREHLQSLINGELEEEDDDDYSWEGSDSSSEEEEDGESSENDSSAEEFLFIGSSDDDDEDDGEGVIEESDSNGGYTSDDDDGGHSSDDDNEGGSRDDDGDTGAGPQIKHRKYLGAYWW